jgi:hypothetical protein
MSGVMHSLVGYDRLSERVAEEFDVPDAALPQAKELAGVPDADPDAIMCYPLDASRARDLADLIKARIDPQRHDYFLEGVSHEFADDSAFRTDPQGWSVWIHHDREKDHVKVIVARTTLDAYASKHGQDYRAVLDRLDAKIKSQVQRVINRAIAEGCATAMRREQDHTFARLELNEHDLGVMLDE